jgi:hypothetical protein
MRQEKEEDTTEKRLLPGLFAKEAERNMNFWTSSEASQPIKLILHQNGMKTHVQETDAIRKAEKTDAILPEIYLLRLSILRERCTKGHSSQRNGPIASPFRLI